jgi:hypothetical protein
MTDRDHFEAWNYSAVSKPPGIADRELVKDIPEVPVLDHYADSDEVQQRFLRVYSYWIQARQAQAEERKDRLVDHEYYDHHQWRPEDAAELRDRGQIPLVLNNVQPACDWLIGTERRSRVDWRILPRRKEDAPEAEVKTALLKYVSDVNDVQFNRSDAFKDAVVSGLGWAEVGIRDPEPGGEKLFYRYRDWRNIWHDHLGKYRDMSDWRYLHDAIWCDLDMAVAMFPDRKEIILLAAQAGNTLYDDFDLDNAEDNREFYPSEEFSPLRRSRVRLITTWYREPERVTVFRGENIGALDGMLFNPEDPLHVEIYESGLADTADTIRMSVRCMFWLYPPGRRSVLADMRSPYRHNTFPYIPFFGKRRRHNGTYYGLVRGLRDVQDDLNKRRSKALFLLSTRGIIADEDAFTDPDEAADEASRPDMFLLKRRGSDVRLINDTELAISHVNIMNEDKRYIEDIVGGSGEALGRETNAASGKAILARQEQGTIMTVEFFDNLRWAVLQSGRVMLSLIEQFYSDEKIIRIVGNQGAVRFERINYPGETGGIENDMTRAAADFVVDEQNYSASIRQSMFSVLGDFLARIDPQIAVSMMDIWIDLSDIPGKDVLVQRIRKMTGMGDPDAEEENVQTAEDQAKAQQAEYQAMLAQLEILEKQAGIAKDQADAKAKEAGILFDQEKLRLERAKLASDIENQRESERIDRKSVV